MTDSAWAIIGLGRAGSALAEGLLRAGCPVCAGIVRTNRSAARLQNRFGFPVTTNLSAVGAARRLLIAVPDTEIGPVVSAIANPSMAGVIALHISATVPVAALAPLSTAGAAVGSCHPLLSLTGKASVFSGAHFAIDGDEPAVACARKLARLLGGHPLTLPPDGRTLYHAAAVMAANYVVTLVDCAGRVLERIGFDGQEASAMLAPLIASVADNVRGAGTGAALTGPIARGDLETVRLHIDALEGLGDEELLAVYKRLGLLSVSVAVREGMIGDDTARLFRTILS